MEPATPMRRSSTTESMARVALVPSMTPGAPSPSHQLGFDFSALDLHGWAEEDDDDSDVDFKQTIELGFDFDEPAAWSRRVTPVIPVDTSPVAKAGYPSISGAVGAAPPPAPPAAASDEEQKTVRAETAAKQVAFEAEQRNLKDRNESKDGTCSFHFNAVPSCTSLAASDDQSPVSSTSPSFPSALKRQPSAAAVGTPKASRARTASKRQSSAPPTPRSRGSHIAIMTNGSRGDVQPAIAIAHCLTRMNHTIRILTNANLVRFCRDHGVDAVEVFPDTQAVIDEVGGMGQDLMAANKGCKQAAEKWLRDNPGVCVSAEDALEDFQPGLVICASQASGPAVRYELATGVPVVHAWLNQDVLDYFHHLGEMQPPRPSLLPVSSLCFQVPTSKYKLPHLHQTADWVLDEQPSQAELADNGPLGPLRCFLQAGSAPVALGWGSMTAQGMPPIDMLKLALRAAKALESRAVILGGWARLHLEGQNLVSGRLGHLGDDIDELATFARENVFFIEGAPHAWLYPQCKAIVHHGGNGTMHAALRSCRPQVVTPIFADQFPNAQAVDMHGAGVGFSKALPKISADELTKALRRATAARAVKAAEKLGEQINRGDGVKAAARAVDLFIRKEVQTGSWMRAFRKLRPNVKPAGGASTAKERSPRRARQPPRHL
eukprot:gnl/TRDRNA2_/TRDRNA2_163847_c5_seq3.p1 gnl/TRDRNA2_/TRDRNA2_163847_c5~~gnl/TRDRNA2_/TRDRNA2_163847_c5_seq3.p1  ORF type:complete len:688 (+),score=111.91 gnl/TRDRNA2_/TRDRNA2_163847_c5_seq3:79-2064(+)